jgi:HSP20 family protein
MLDALAEVQDEFNRVFEDGGLSWNTSRYPRLNVWTSDDSVVVNALMPGVKPEDVRISVEGTALVLSGSRPTGNAEQAQRRESFAGEFSRSIPLPFGVESGKVTAKYRNGMLRITLPRAEAEKPRQVTIEAA